jgi:hypothetical protein
MEKIRGWKDLERPNKVAIIIGVFAWLLLETGVYMETRRWAQMKQNVFKTEMVKQR